MTIKLEINAETAADLLRQVQGLQLGATGINNATNSPEPERNEKEGNSDLLDRVENELTEALAKLEESNLKVAALEKSVTKLDTQLKDAEAGAEKAHKAFLEEQKRADAAEARVKDLETQLKAASAKPADSAPADNATNDDEADEALDTGSDKLSPTLEKLAGAATHNDDGKAKPGARTNRTTRNVSKPAEETADQKALRETITNDLLDLGGLAEKNAQVATDVEEVLAKYSVSNGADLTTEQLEDAAADIAELIGVYFRE